MSASAMSVEALMARVAALEAENGKLASQVRFFEGRLQASQPRDDGKPGSKFYGSIKFSRAALAARLAKLDAEGRAESTENLSVYERTNSQTGEVFMVIQSTGEYVKKDE